MISKLRRISFEVTGKCNINCLYCCRGYLNSPERISNEISTEQVLKVINEAKGIGCNSFLFTGGEAFLKEDFEKILASCTGCFVEIYSNGTLINLPKNKKLIKRYVSRLTVTIDGLEAHNYYRKGSDYKQILQNIRELKKFAPQIKIKINTLVNKETVPELLQLYSLLKGIGIDEWHVDFPQLRGRLAGLEGEFSADYAEIGKNISKLLAQYYKDGEPFFLKVYKIFNSRINESNYYNPSMDENPCAYKADYSMFINAGGKYVLCPSIPCQDITIGQVDKNNLVEAIKIKENLPFKSVGFKDLKDCLDCRYFSLCLGGCRGEARILNGSLLAPDLNACNMMAIAEEIIYPNLPKEKSAFYMNLIKKDKLFPARLSSMDKLRKDSHKQYVQN